MTSHVPTSALLSALLDDATAERITLGMLVARLGSRSFGLVMLMLALLAMMPGVSAFIGVLLCIVAVQMILGRPGPVFPRRIAARPFSTRILARTLRRAVPILRYAERFVRPRWMLPAAATRRAVGLAVLAIGLLLFTPVPLSNIPPALTVMVIALAYLERDGLLLGAALAATALFVAVGAGAAWQAMDQLGWVQGFL